MWGEPGSSDPGQAREWRNEQDRGGVCGRGARAAARRGIPWHRFQGITLWLADNTFCIPDFAVRAADGVMELHEVKGLPVCFRTPAAGLWMEPGEKPHYASLASCGLPGRLMKVIQWVQARSPEGALSVRRECQINGRGNDSSPLGGAPGHTG